MVDHGPRTATTAGATRNRGRRCAVLAVAIAACHSGRTTDDAPPHEGRIDARLQAEIDAVPTELRRIVDGAVFHFQTTVTANEGRHMCPHFEFEPGGGSTDATPVLALDCNGAADRRCNPRQGGGGAGSYDSRDWTNNSMWTSVGFAKTEPHSFHYELVTKNSVVGFGACSFTARAFGDLDGDLVFSTYELRGRVDGIGAQLEPMIAVQPLE